MVAASITKKTFKNSFKTAPYFIDSSTPRFHTRAVVRTWANCSSPRLFPPHKKRFHIIFDGMFVLSWKTWAYIDHSKPSRAERMQIVFFLCFRSFDSSRCWKEFTIFFLMSPFSLTLESFYTLPLLRWTLALAILRWVNCKFRIPLHIILAALHQVLSLDRFGEDLTAVRCTVLLEAAVLKL